MTKIKLMNLYIVNSLIKNGYLIRKILRIRNTNKFIAFSLIFEFCIALLITYLLGRILLPSHENIFLAVILFLSCSNVLNGITKTRQQFDKEYNISHFLLYVNEPHSFIKKMILIDWMVRFFHSLLTIIPISFYILIQGKELFFFPSLLLVEIVLFSLNLLFRVSSQQKWFSTLINILIKGIVCFISFIISTIFIKMMIITRHNIDLYGYKLIAIMNLNSQLDKALKQSRLFNFYENIHNFYIRYIHLEGVILGVLLLLTISIVSFKYSYYFTDKHFKIKFIQFPYKTLKRDHYYTFADFYSLKNISNNLKRNPIDLFFTGEVAISLGLSLATVHYIHNEIIIFLIMFFQLHLIFKGVISTTSHIFSNIFKFEQECSMFSLFSIYKIDKVDILYSKYELLKRTVLQYLLINLVLFFIAISVISVKQSFAFLVLAALFFIMKNEYVLYSLRTNFDVFSILLEEKAPPQISKLNEFKGFALIATSNNIVSRFITQFVFLGVIIIAMFKIVSGMLWIYILLLIAVGIYTQIIYSNRDYKIYKDVHRKGQQNYG